MNIEPIARQGGIVRFTNDGKEFIGKVSARRVFVETQYCADDSVEPFYDEDSELAKTLVTWLIGEYKKVMNCEFEDVDQDDMNALIDALFDCDDPVIAKYIKLHRDLYEARECGIAEEEFISGDIREIENAIFNRPNLEYWQVSVEGTYHEETGLYDLIIHSPYGDIHTYDESYEKLMAGDFFMISIQSEPFYGVREWLKNK